jgi:hypothetical protein
VLGSLFARPAHRLLRPDDAQVHAARGSRPACTPLGDEGCVPYARCDQTTSKCVALGKMGDPCDPTAPFPGLTNLECANGARRRRRRPRLSAALTRPGSNVLPFLPRDGTLDSNKLAT